MSIAPFQLQPRPAARVWGGDALARRFGRSFAGDSPIGESWEVYGELTVVNGPYAGQTLDQVTRLLGTRLLGSRGADPSEGFPLLVKWLDCRQWLSLQLHPDDAMARQLTGLTTARGKSECWYFLDVEEGAQVIQGHKALPTAFPEGREWLELVERHDVLPGQWMYTPAGTIHALGPGLVLFEVQQSSDLTYRLYDWDRVGLDGVARPLHLEEARQVLSRPAQLPPAPSSVEGCLGKVAILSPYFVIEEIQGQRSWFPDGQSFEILTVMDGAAQLSWDGGTIGLKSGDSALVAADSPALRMETEGGRPWVRIRLSC